MHLGNTPLLITATFDAGRTPLVALSQCKERVEKYMEGLIAWLEDPLCQRIVFAKNCSTPIRKGVLESVAGAYGKELEYLEVSASPRTIIQGKGYGEGDLILQALEKSEMLRSSDDFFKMTGKLYSPEMGTVFSGIGEGEFYSGSIARSGDPAPARRMISSLYRSAKGSNGLAFLRRWARIPWSLIAPLQTGWIDTRFYRVRRDFYGDFLLHSHLRVQDALGYTLENAFFDDLEHSSARIIEQQPVILGTSGTFGTTAGEYSQEIRTKACELAVRLIV